MYFQLANKWKNQFFSLFNCTLTSFNSKLNT